MREVAADRSYGQQYYAVAGDCVNFGAVQAQLQAVAGSRYHLRFVGSQNASSASKTPVRGEVRGFLSDGSRGGGDTRGDVLRSYFALPYRPSRLTSVSPVGGGVAGVLLLLHGPGPR